MSSEQPPCKMQEPRAAKSTQHTKATKTVSIVDVSKLEPAVQLLSRQPIHKTKRNHNEASSNIAQKASTNHAAAHPAPTPPNAPLRISRNRLPRRRTIQTPPPRLLHLRFMRHHSPNGHRLPNLSGREHLRHSVGSVQLGKLHLLHCGELCSHQVSYCGAYYVESYGWSYCVSYL